MLARLRTRFSDPNTRRIFGAIIAGKMIAAVLLVAAIKGIEWYFASRVYADGAAPPVPAYVNPLNTMWTLIAAFLVFFMQAGFMCLEAGFARTRETVNILGGGTAQLKAQLIGSASVTAATFAIAMALMYSVKAMGFLRVSEEGETEGIDLSEHGGHAYPELIGGLSGAFTGEASSAPSPAPVRVPAAASSS